MKTVRLIARLDIKGPDLIKGIRLEGLRKMGDPQKFAGCYYEEGADELLYMDTVASLYERGHLADIVRRTAEEVFIPMTVGGGVRTVEDVKELLRAGADKVAVNTEATRRPELIQEIAKRFGSQCAVLSIEAKRVGAEKWEAYRDNGREHTGLDVVEWALRGQSLGAGEILLTSVDQEGTMKGFDLDLVKTVTRAVSIPVIASGGMGSLGHLRSVVIDSGADAVAAASVLHYQKISLGQMKEALSEFCQVRTI